MIAAISIVVGLVLLAYTCFIAVQCVRLLRLQAFDNQAGFLTPPQLLVLVPFRNEVDGLKNLLPALQAQTQDCRFLEVVFINDSSTDGGEKWLAEHIKSTEHFHLVHSSTGGKKHALLAGMEGRDTDYYVTLDADCMPRPNWLKTISDAVIARRPDMLILPMVEQGSGLGEKLRSLDFLSLMGMTASFAQSGKALMANGGNLVFSKPAFERVGGYQSHLHISSGDDIYLLQALQSSGNAVIEYLLHPSTIVPTRSTESWTSFFKQRARWGSKTSAMGARATRISALIGLVVLLQLFAWLIPLFTETSWWLFWGIWMVKFVVDFIFLSITATKLHQQNLLALYPISALMYPLTLFITAVVMRLPLQWKDREVVTG